MNAALAFFGLMMACGTVGAAPQSTDPPAPTQVSSSRVRPPLLREGGYLVRMPGEVTADTSLGVHRFRPLQVEEGGIRRELILLPSRAMDDLLRLQAAQKTGEFDPTANVFEITGRVLVYRGRNFLLPDAVVVIRRSAAEERAEAESPDTVGAAPEDQEQPVSTDEDDLARSIEARLEERIGAVPRSVDIALSPAALSEPATFREGLRLQERRGHVVRDPASGTWRFIFEGSSTSMELLPCKELERMEQTTRQRAVPRAVTLSGRVTAFHGQNFLLPTSFRTARGGLGIGH